MKNNFEYKRLSPFKLWVCQNFPFIDADFDAITEWQLFGKISEKMNEIIASQNQVGSEMQNLVQSFNSLYDYVMDYFNHLDVQDEINNKLNEMVEDGTLLNLLSNYTYIQKIYDTFEDLISDTTIVENQIVKCLGYSDINDGNGGEFIISTTSGIPLNGNFKAMPLDNYKENFYNEITFVKERHDDTDCYIVDVPLNDINNNQINLIVEEKDYSSQSPLMHAQDNLTSLTINCGCAILNDQDQYVGAIVIGNGEVLDDTSQYGASYVPDWYLYVGIKEDRSIQDFKINNTTANQLLTAGCKNVFGAYFKLIENYVPVDLTGVTVNGEDTVTTKHPRQVLCEMQNGDIKIFTCDGRTALNKGLTASEVQTILVAKDVKNAWNLDGGGSTSTSYKTFKINRNIDDRGRTDRQIRWTLNAKKITKNKPVAETYSFISKLFHLFNSRYIDEKVYEHNISNQDLNNLIGELYFGMGTNLTHSPENYTGGYFINMTDNITYNNLFLYNKQFFFPLATNKIFTREQYNNVWSGWVEINAICSPSYNSKTLSSTATYEEIPVNSVENLDGDSIIKNEDNTFSFKNVKNRIFQLTCRVKNSTGLKFIKIQRNNVDAIAVSNYNSDTNEHEITMVGKLIVGSTNDKYKLLAYGNTGDVFERFNVTIQ